MKHKTKLLAALIVLGSVSGTVLAANPGAYLGIGAGYSTLDTSKDKLADVPKGQAVEKNSRDIGGVGARLFAGYNFNQYIGVELGIAHYAPSEYQLKVNAPGIVTVNEKLTYSLNAADLVAKAYLPIADTGFNLYALGGVAYVKSEAKVTANGSFYGEGFNGKESKSNNQFRPKYGVGVSYAIPETPVTASLEVSRIQGTGKLSKDNLPNLNAIPNANEVSLNISYNFG